MQKRLTNVFRWVPSDQFGFETQKTSRDGISYFLDQFSTKFSKNNLNFSGPLDHNPPLRSSRQDIRGSIQFFHGDFQNGSSQDEKTQKVDRQLSQPQHTDAEQYYPIKRQMSSDTITLNKNYNKGSGDGGFYLNRDAPDGEMGNKMTFADMNKLRSNGDNTGRIA